MHHLEVEHEDELFEEHGVSYTHGRGLPRASSRPDHVDHHPHMPGPLFTVKQAQENKHHRVMGRSLRVHGSHFSDHVTASNAHRITF